MAFSSRSSLPNKTRQSTLHFGKITTNPQTPPHTPSHSPKRKNSGHELPLPRKGVSTTEAATRRILILSDDDDNDQPVRRAPNKRRRRNQHLIDDDSDEDTGNNASDDDVNSNNVRLIDSDDNANNKNSDTTTDEDLDDDAFADNVTHANKQLNASSTANKLVLLGERFPTLTREFLVQVLRDHGGQFTPTLAYLQKHQQTPTIKKPRRLVRQIFSDSEDDDDDDSQAAQLETTQRLQRAVQTVKFYNTATPQEIMDVTGCKLASAEKLISMRPFETMEDLETKLKQQRGLSSKFINDYLEVMEGYSAVDQIIQNIEDIGGQLQDILDVWQTIGSADNQKDDDEAGTHLVDITLDTQGMDTATDLYKDAMDGFLTRQPDIVNPEFDLKSYQITGLNWMLLLYRKGISGILADEMGLGKTAQVISFLGRLYELGEAGPHMIVVPSSTLDNWLREFDRFCPDLQVRCYYGTQNERRDLQQDIMEDLDDIHAIVTTYAVATGRVEDRNFLRRLRCKSMILDEGHMVKNYTSARYGHLMRLGTPFRLLLTGTPLQNNLQELVSLLIFIMPDIFSGNEDDVRKIFKLKTSSTGGGNTDSSSAAQMLSRQRIQRAKKMMTPFVLRRRKAHVLSHLPKKIHHVDYCPMTPTQHGLYTQIVTDSQKRYNDVIMDDNGNTSANKSKLEKFSNIVMQLRKAADHPLLFRYIYNDTKIKQMAKEIMRDERYWNSEEQYIYEDMEVMTDFELNRLCKDHKAIRHHMLTNNEWMDAGKVQHLKQLLPDMKQKGSKVLLFSQFTSMLDILEPVMKTLGLSFLRLDGSTKVAERQVLIDQFNQDESLDVFLLSTKAGGFGINLTSANVVVMYDMDFNPQNDKQAEDRAHRVGQTKDVIVHKLLSDQTIEHQILAMADIRLRLDRSVSGVDGGDVDDVDGRGGDGDNSDDQGMDQVKMKSLLKSVLLQS